MGNKTLVIYSWSDGRLADMPEDSPEAANAKFYSLDDLPEYDVVIHKDQDNE